MNKKDRALRAGLIALIAGLASPVLGQSETNGTEAAADRAAVAAAERAPITRALESVSEDVRRYNDHLTTLASPWMEGRVPGSRGAELAREYVEYWLKQAGLEPAFESTVEREDGTAEVVRSYRQPFPLGGSVEVTAEEFALSAGDRKLQLSPGQDFRVTGMGRSGQITAPITFVGYGIQDGPEGYSSFEEGDDLSGKIAMVLRFEPMGEGGRSLWNEGDGWSRRAGLAGKIGAVAQRNPEAIILVNTPGAEDPRIAQLMGPSSGGRMAEVPVVHMSPEAASRLVKAADAEGRSLMDLRRLADAGRAVVDLGGTATLNAQMERTPLIAENIGGMIPGRGDLADEYIIIGAHMDHLGMGTFGSRAEAAQQGTTLHPGADDNASGTAGILLIAEWLNEQFEQLPEDASARSVVVVAFDGEESGLNGSRFYVNNPIGGTLDNHYLMMNFDMIGRIKDGRLSVSGTGTGQGLTDITAPIFEQSPLTIVERAGSGGGSDHLPFLQRQIPILFAIIADFHGDYHTPADTSDKINRVDAVHAARLFNDIALAAAQRSETMPFVTPERPAEGRRARGPEMDINVRFGIMPGNYDGEDGGVLVAGVTPGSSAAEAGLKDGDRLMRWDGRKIADVREWMGMLAEHDPGDQVKVGVMRDGTEITLEVTLQGRDSSGG